MTVSATDKDDPMTDNAILSFSIIGQETIPPNAVTKTMFGINSLTGAIYLKEVGLDREVRRATKSEWRRWLLEIIVTWLILKHLFLFQVVKGFKLKLQVADMGGMGLTSDGLAVINVSDINNHAPQFNPDTVSLSNRLMWTQTVAWILTYYKLCVTSVQRGCCGEQEGLRDLPG